MSRTAHKARAHYLWRSEFTITAVREARRLFRRTNPKKLDESYRELVHPQLFRKVSLAQATAASFADDFLDDVTGADSEGDLNPDAFSGIAADGRDLDTLLELPLRDALDTLHDDTFPGLSATQRQERAMQAGQSTLDRIVASEVQDAGRTADQVALVARPQVQGYVRTLVLPSCSRCVLLAGRVYRWNEGFLRHPGCDCTHTPVTDLSDVPADVTTDPEEAVRAGLVTGLSAADTRAIEDGADVGQVVNAVRGTKTAADGTKTTTEGTGRSGLARQRRGRKPRLRPESIYALYPDRADAISALRDNGYIL